MNNEKKDFENLEQSGAVNAPDTEQESETTDAQRDSLNKETDEKDEKSVAQDNTDTVEKSVEASETSLPCENEDTFKSQGDADSSDVEGSEEESLETLTIDASDTELESDGKDEDGAKTEEIVSEDNGKEDNVPSPDKETEDKKVAKKKEKKEEKVSFLQSTFDFLEMFVFTLVAVLVITSFIIRPSVVNGDSMQNTLENQQVLLVSELFYTPKKGDIVVVEDYSTVLKKPIVKRVIATEGDIVRITKKAVFVNGEILDEPYVRIDFPDYEYSTWYMDCFGEKHDLRFGKDFYEITVPKGELFILGDHRNASKDSREIGTVDADAVIGKVLIRIMPFDSFGRVE